MKFIDTHIHLQDYKTRYARDIISSAAKVGVERFICVGTTPEDWEAVAELYVEFPQEVIPSFGYHPWYVNSAPLDWEEQLVKYLLKYPEALVGECGLDRCKDPNSEPQHSFFYKQILLAKKYSRPLIIHSVKCQDWLENFWSLLPEKVVFHSYSGSPELMQKIIRHGAYVSFGFSILKHKDFATLAALVPENRLLLESDGPYQSPLRDEESTPQNLPDLLQKIASFRGVIPEDLAAKIYQNSCEFISNGK